MTFEDRTNSRPFLAAQFTPGVKVEESMDGSHESEENHHSYEDGFKERVEVLQGLMLHHDDCDKMPDLEIIDIEGDALDKRKFLDTTDRVDDAWCEGIYETDELGITQARCFEFWNPNRPDLEGRKRPGGRKRLISKRPKDFLRSMTCFTRRR